jgi:hypothetical protein
MAKPYLSTSVNRPLGSAAYQERASFPSNLKDWDRIFKQSFISPHSVKILFVINTAQLPGMDQK